MKNKNTLRVFANPFCALDTDGEPAGACPFDPNEHGPDRRFVGASHDPKRTVVLDQRQEGDLRSARQHIKFSFEADVQTVPITSYYADRIRHGELIAADEATAQYAGVPFEAPAKALDRAKNEAIAKYESFYGKGSSPLSDTKESNA